MENNQSSPETILQHEQLTLCNSLKEVLNVICCYHNKWNDTSASNPDNLQLSISVKKKSDVTKEDLGVFTVKVRCNQDIPLISAIKDMKNSKLIQFVQQMQRHEQESHFALSFTDSNDSSLTRTFVLWISKGEDSKSCVQIQEEILSKRAPSYNDNFVLQLRIFMKTTAVIDEVHSFYRFLCCLKILNPLVDVCVTWEGIHGVDLELNNNEYFSCGETLIVSADPKVYIHRNVPDNDQCHADSSLLKAYYFSRDDTTVPSNKVACVLIFLPKFMETFSQDEKRTTSAEKHGEIFVQVYDSNRQPIDMLQFCIDSHLTPDSLISSKAFKSIMKIKGTSSIASYNMGCSIQTLQDFSLPQDMKECDGFTIWMCFMLEKKTPHSDSMNSGTLDSLKELANLAFQQFYNTNKTESRESQLVPCNKEDLNHVKHSVKNRITDITTSLSDIYIKSTDVSFRAHITQMVPVHTCLSMKSYLQEKLETILINKGNGDVQPMVKTRTNYNDKEEDEWNAFPLSQISSNLECPDGSMSPDSLDLNDHDWDEMNENQDMSKEQTDIFQNEINCISMTQPRMFNFKQSEGSTIQDETLVNSFHSISSQSLLESKNKMKKNKKHLGKSDGNFSDLVYVCEDMNCNSDNAVEKFEQDFKRKEARSSQGHCNGSENIDQTLLVKRTALKMLDSNLKRVKLDRDIVSDINCSQLNNPRSDHIDTDTLSTENELQQRVISDTTSMSSILMRNSENESHATFFVEYGVQDVHVEEKNSDDWFDREEFDNWCAEFAD